MVPTSPIALQVKLDKLSINVKQESPSPFHADKESHCSHATSVKTSCFISSVLFTSHVMCKTTLHTFLLLKV